MLKFITVFSNCGFMGFPVLQSVLAAREFYGALYVIPFNILVLSYGVMVFTGKTDRSVLKEIVIHPVTISVAVGMVLFLSQIKLPVQVFRAAEMVGSMTSPLSMLIVGSLLAAIPFRELFKAREIYAGSFIRVDFSSAGFLRSVPLVPASRRGASGFSYSVSHAGGGGNSHLC